MSRLIWILVYAAVLAWMGIEALGSATNALLG